MKKRLIVVAIFFCAISTMFAKDAGSIAGDVINAMADVGIKVYDSIVPDAEYVVTIFFNSSVKQTSVKSMAHAKSEKDMAIYLGATKVTIRSVYKSFVAGTGTYYADGRYDSEDSWYAW